MPQAPQSARAPRPVASPLPRSVGVSEALAEPRTGGAKVRRGPAVRLRLHGGLPRSLAGRLLAVAGVLAGLAGFTAALWTVRNALLRDPHLVLASSSAIEITGNRHLTRTQLLSVFGEDVERNLLTVPLAERRAELEQLPWVEHATVMRLLPDRLRIAIVERTPVAFVRRGKEIGLIDRNGVLLDINPDVPADTHLSFPVVTGLSADEAVTPLTVRAARMKLYTAFTGELDGEKDHVSNALSEVDLSDPEDVKALIPEGTSDILVHFGERDFLARYRRFERNLPGWRTQYPKLSSVDMRYERQVVLEMHPGSAVPETTTAAASPIDGPASGARLAHPLKPAQTKPAQTKPGQTKPGQIKPGQSKPGLVQPGELKSAARPVTHASLSPGPAEPAARPPRARSTASGLRAPAATPPVPHLQTAFPVRPVHLGNASAPATPRPEEPSPR